ncbi:DUF2281 domain-containing protein [Dyadobacter frigoris]|uniref:DUF2281 domain-containing protein n=1 Tax=Dyadobacter frigoris TaxID=2576211 RepID=A0A4U6D358_9BACT|nr:DUF2281 domain-containing protein [Dyadobacter frigoris]TKT91632.1 DUF2281 domain-containing protein [Dyadobacter frigoris]GLU51804.1 hypothetical protein Dfri01_12650 [Dyadobacter frigoris]
MSRDALIKVAIENLSKLSDQKIKEVTDFAEFLLSKSEDSMLVEGIQKMASESKSFDFLNDEEDIYTIADLKEIYK